MSERMNIVQWREGSTGKKFTVRLGSSWVGKDGKTRLSLDALPIPVDGKIDLVLEPPRELHEQPRQGNRPAARDEGDEIPFFCEWR